MKRTKKWLSILLLLCLLPLSAFAAGYQVDEDIITETTEAEISIPFTGEDGVSYRLHHKHGNIWLVPKIVTLKGTEGTFDVTLGTGVNDFVLTEDGEARTSPNAVAFSITYSTEPAAPASAANAAASVSPTVFATLVPAAQSAVPSASPTPAAATPDPTAEATPEPTPEPTAEPTPEPSPEPTPVPVDMGQDRAMLLWMEGDDVLVLQEGLLTLKYNFGKADGVYGPRTRAAVMRFQRRHDIKADGIVGTDTRAKLAEYGIEIPLYFAPDMTMPEGFDRELSFGKRGMDVYRLQERLSALGYLEEEPDQVYGRRTRAAIRAFQTENGLKADGVAGPETLRMLFE